MDFWQAENLALFHRFLRYNAGSTRCSSLGRGEPVKSRNALFPPGGSLMYRPPVSSVSGSLPRPDVESTIRGLTQDFCTAFNTGNYDQVARLYASDGVFMVSHRELC